MSEQEGGNDIVGSLGARGDGQRTGLASSSRHRDGAACVAEGLLDEPAARTSPSGCWVIAAR